MNAPRFSKRQALLGTTLLAMMLFTPRAVHGLIFASTDDPAFNSSEPTGDLAGSGWQFQGVWNGFPGTPVSPHHFLAARHIGGTVGGSFFFAGTAYTTVGLTNNGTDLNVWEVAGEFPVYAPLYSGANPVGQPVVIFGRGTRRGVAVWLNGQLKGWHWGAADGVLRWGENVVAGKFGSLLKFNFDRNTGPNEVHLSSGDSGGGIFVNDGGTWKLAAINYAVEGPWKLTSTGATFNAALLDKGGLYRGTTLYPEDDPDSPTAFYATPIAANHAWLLSVLNLPPTRPEVPRGFRLEFSAASPGATEPEVASAAIEP